MHPSHAISPPIVLTNIISQLKGWGVVPLKATKAAAGRLQYHLANWERDQGQVGPRYGKRLPNRIHKRPLPEDETAHTTVRGGVHGAN